MIEVFTYIIAAYTFIAGAALPLVLALYMLERGNRD